MRYSLSDKYMASYSLSAKNPFFTSENGQMLESLASSFVSFFMHEFASVRTVFS